MLSEIDVVDELKDNILRAEDNYNNAKKNGWHEIAENCLKQISEMEHKIDLLLNT